MTRRTEGLEPVRVLVVDDSEPVRTLLTVNLRLEGFEVQAVSDGQQALDLVREWRPDVMTLDVVMPVLDGFAVLERLREDPGLAAIPVVIVTGRATVADRARGDSLGVDAYVSKPFEPSELVALVTDLAEHGRRSPTR